MNDDEDLSYLIVRGPLASGQVVTPGRIVHYVDVNPLGSNRPELCVAIVTAVTESSVDLHVLDTYRHVATASGVIEEAPAGDGYAGHPVLEVPFSVKLKRGHWSWPPRAGT